MNATAKRAFAPWELKLIDLWKKTGEKYGRLPFGNFWYAAEKDFLYLAAGNTRHYIHYGSI